MSYHSSEIVHQDYFDKQYKFSRPEGPLGDIVSFFWELDLRDRRFAGDDFNERIFANLNTSLVFNLGSSFTISDGQKQAAINTHTVIGQRTAPIIYSHIQGNFLVGIKFNPGGLARVTGIPAHELSDHLVDAELLFRQLPEGLLYDAADAQTRFRILEQLLTRSLSVEKTGFRSDYVRQALHCAADHRYNVKKLADSVHVTPRSLERYFQQVIGLTPKSSLSILRFRDALSSYLRYGSTLDAEALGYADFSHLVKDIRRFYPAETRVLTPGLLILSRLYTFSFFRKPGIFVLNTCAMKGPTLNANFFTGNRQRLYEKLAPGALAILNTNDTLPTNADGTYRFKPNNDLYYLCGITQEETILVLFPDHPYAEHREILFISEPNELYAKWNGRQLSISEAAVISGIEQVLYVHQFNEWLQRHIARCEHVYLNSNEHARAHIEYMDRDARFAQWCRERYPAQSYRRLAPVLAGLRMIKSQEEIAVMRHACAITERGFRRLLRFVKPGVKEKQVQAEMIHEYLNMDADWADYKPIVASGADSCILHYISNHKVCADGDILLIDAAASWLNYNADLTRAIPVNGRFTHDRKPFTRRCLKCIRPCAMS